jgi:hypothetical protein
MESKILYQNEIMGVTCVSCGADTIAYRKARGRLDDFCEECRAEIKAIETKRTKYKEISYEYGSEDYYTWMNGDDGLYF